MPVSLVVGFERTGGHGEPLGHQVHGWLLGCIAHWDAGLADRLHRDDRAKPFSVMTLGTETAGQEKLTSVRIACLDDTLGHLLVGLDPRALADGYLGHLSVRVARMSASSLDHPLARAESYEALLALARTGDGTAPITLEFVTPTAFAAEDRGVTLFPYPHLVFRSLARKWNKYAPMATRFDEGAIDELCRTCSVSSYTLETRQLRLGARPFTGFVGRCEFDLPRSSNSIDILQVARALVGYGLYAGVGTKTTMGMGQVIPGDYHRRLELERERRWASS